MEIVSKEIKSIYEKIRIKVVEPLTVRRTRTDLKENEAYKKDLDNQGVIFPDVKPPHKIYYQLDPNLEQLYDKEYEWIWKEGHIRHYHVNDYAGGYMDFGAWV